MDLLLSIANWLLPLAYLALAIDYGATFILRTRIHARTPGILLAGIFHVAFLASWAVRSDGLALGSIPELLSVIALCSTLVYGATETVCRDRRAGAFVFLLVFLVQYSSAVSLAGGPSGLAGPEADARSGWALLHYVPAALAYTAIAFAAVYDLLYLSGQRSIKQHRVGLLFDRLPPLELLGRMSWYALLVGLAFITVAIVTGAVLWGGGGSASPDHAPDPKIIAKIVTGLAAWAACTVAVLGRWLGRWSVARVSQIAVAGSAVVLVLFVSSAVLS
ncbi:MAG: cytochrome c biogenesis protein CcsA [Planctomycetota bacterium]|jgi:ABC-type uncharacterized transport system permease subunit